MPQKNANLPQDNDLDGLSSETAAQIVRVGEMASHALNNPIFNMVYNHLHQQYADEFRTSEPHEQKKREHLYHMQSALTDVYQSMASAVADAESVLEQQRNLTDPNQVRQNHLDSQGFAPQFQTPQ